jgi:hypothetical protein
MVPDDESKTGAGCCSTCGKHLRKLMTFHVSPKDGITIPPAAAYLVFTNFDSREKAQAEIDRLGVGETMVVRDGSSEDAPIKIVKGTK